jgi:hypothetical protein
MSKDSNSSTDQKLEVRLERLEKLFVCFADTGTVQNTLGQGFDAMSGHMCTLNERLEILAAVLSPLRCLSGPSATFSDAQRAHLKALLAAHARPAFTNISSLKPTDCGLRFIGASLPTRDATPNQETRSFAS